MGTAVSWMDSSPSSLPQPIHARNLILSLSRPRDSARKPFTIPSPEKLTEAKASFVPPFLEMDPSFFFFSIEIKSRADDSSILDRK